MKFGLHYHSSTTNKNKDRDTIETPGRHEPTKRRPTGKETK